MEEGDLEPYVRRRRSSNEKAKNRLMKMDPVEQDRLRQCINSRERKRMHNLNSALDQLRNSLPNSKNPATKKLSKINTIVTASEWIVRLMQENDMLRKKLSDLGTSIPPLQFSISTMSHQNHHLQHPSPPFISSSPKGNREEIKQPKKKVATPKATAAVAAPPPPPPPPLDPAPQINAAAFFSNFLPNLPPNFFPNFLHHQAAAAVAAAAVSTGTTFLPQRLGNGGGGQSPLTLSMPTSQIPEFCFKDCGNNGGVCLCVKCLLSNKNTVS
uniref:BHLH domain-containing protein n=1 Tax=Panagrolaimus davidi TaxID=227884 RepID=A0A914P700_9BILA